MRHRLTTSAALAAGVSLLGACATSAPTGSSATGSPTTGSTAAGTARAASAGSGTPAQQQALARYTAYAGPPLPYFTWLGQFYSWEPLSKDQLVVFTTPGEAYLLKVWPPCDLRFVINAIGITSTARTVYARLDSITTNGAGTGPGQWRCPIDEIRRIDYSRMRADMHAQAQHKVAPQPNPAAQPIPAPLPGQAAPANPPP